MMSEHVNGDPTTIPMAAAPAISEVPAWPTARGFWELTEWQYQSTFRPLATLEELMAVVQKQWPKAYLAVRAGGVVYVYEHIDADHDIATAVWRAIL